ncbi:MAG: hypothetical protein KF886_21215 [Candidatus Hydrogenedentes bacterium]|nr:hypothetical protein [Candidatus Hydrogenedentota bacterium]
MKRRSFLRTGALAAGLGLGAGSAPAQEAAERLPETQWKPDPDLGTHWDLFQKISAKCAPEMTFLQDRYNDPEAWTREARAKLVDCFHYTDTERDPQPGLVHREDRGDFFRERIELYTTAGQRAGMYLLVPKNLNRPAPGIVALHDHGGFYLWGKEKLTKVDPVHPALQKFKDQYYGGRDLADELARLGYVVAVPDMLHWGERGMYFEKDPDRVKNRTMDLTEDDIKQFNARSWAHEEILGRTALAAGTTVSGIITWDDMCAADYLCSRPEVDAERVGCVGLSVGSVRTIFLGALHPKVRASVAVCWMSEYQPLIRNNIRWAVGFSKLVPGLYQHLDWPDLGGLHWPGALMTINGLKDELYPIDAAQRAVRKIEDIFEKMGAPDNFEGVFFDGPHEFNLAMQERAFAFLGKHLAEKEA